MKRKSLLSTGITLVACVLFSTTPAFALTTHGAWQGAYQTIYLPYNSSNSAAWQSGASMWKNNTNFQVTTSNIPNSNYYIADVNDSNATWDGLTTYTRTGYFITKAILQLNTYYTSASKYTASIKAGVTGHEVGHSLGLDHASLSQIAPSIMWTYTFNSDNTPSVRSLTPSAGDISDVNTLYFSSPTSYAQPTAESTSVTSNSILMSPSWAIYYKNEKELTDAADLVVKGKVVKEKGSKFLKGVYTTYQTNVDVEVKEVLKGDTSPNNNKTIEVSQMGGNDGLTNVIPEHTTFLKNNQEITLFLKKTGTNTYIPINEDDSIFINDSNNNKYKNIRTKIELNTSIFNQ